MWKDLCDILFDIDAADLSAVMLLDLNIEKYLAYLCQRRHSVLA